MSIHRVLVVDDDSKSRDSITAAVIALGYQAEAVASAEAALECIGSREFDLVMADLLMAGTSGLDLASHIGRDHQDLPVVLMAAQGSVDTVVDAMGNGVADFLTKPVSSDTIDLVINRLERTRQLEQENAYLRSELAPHGEAEIISVSKSMQETLGIARRVSASKGTVLITGENGTGKERVAQYVHGHSTRAADTFIRINCASFSETLLESELFGHEKGALAGASERRQGRMELADGGTLLLDEIGEISTELQARLLRVLESGEFERVGGSDTLVADVRVIATTTLNLTDEVKAGRFREDLYYHLHVMPIHLAPLRDRVEDILPLAAHFAARYAGENGRTTPLFTQDAMDRLISGHWPGNVRELENAVQRAVALTTGDTITGGDLVGAPQERISPFERRITSQTNSIWSVSSNNPLADHSLREIERFAILSTIESSGGNKTEAARRLGVTARTLSNKMKLWRSMGLVA